MKIFHILFILVTFTLLARKMVRMDILFDLLARKTGKMDMLFTLLARKAIMMGMFLLCWQGRR